MALLNVVKQLVNTANKGNIMKMDHPPISKDMAAEEHMIHPEHIEKHHGGDGHMQHHEHFKKHAAGHMLHHEHVKAMCGGGYAKGKK
jgi:hypothetical protein